MTELRALAAEIRSDPAPLDAYVGRSLAEAFAVLVLRDRRFYVPMHATVGKTVRGMTCISHNTGLKWPSQSGLWPVRPGWFDLVAGWFDPEVVAYGIEVDGDGEQLPKAWAELNEAGDADMAPFHDAAEVIAALLARFLAPLQDGRIEALGHAIAGNMALGPISSTVWSRPATRFDAIDSGVSLRTGFDVDASKRFRFEILSEEFRAVTLDLADTSQEYKPVPKRGRPREYPYSKGMDAVLNIILRNGLPRNGTELCRMLEKELTAIAGYSPDLSRLAQDIGKRDETLYRSVTGKPPN